FEDLKEQRYSSFKKGIGAKIISGKENLESLTNYALKNDEPIIESSHIEYVKNILNDYLY
ncbi:TPA: xylose isomerase, partial [Enterococcus faecalis]|nr:xylose isomerase [Enterococcus faecalis]